MTTLQERTPINFDPLEFRIARMRLRWTIRHLAEQLDYSACWITLCENGRAKPSRRLLKAWANELEM